MRANVLDTPLLKEPGYLPDREEIETWRGAGTSRFDNWDDYVNHNPLGFSFEILNRDFIESFGNYIVSRVEDILNHKGCDVNIVETGAGSGRLGYFLRRKLKDYESSLLNIISTDDFSWEEAAFNPYFRMKRHFPVEKMGYDEAMELDPDIVITSWMPLNEDWTKAYRKRTTVKEYILIGSQSDCGNSDTWNKRKIKNDGFEMKKLDIYGQMCFRDFPGHYNHSKTISFFRR